MKRMRLAICVAAFAVVGGIAVSQDIDVQGLQAKLAAQEARLADLQAKMNTRSGGSDEASGLVSLRKNAVVTLGGQVNTRYFYRNGKTNSRLTVGDMVDGGGLAPSTPPNGAQGVQTGLGNRVRTEDYKHGDLRISDAKVEMKIDVNEYFDAYLKMDLHDGAGRSSVSGIAQNYWVRWKNVCNSGFGLLIGRDALKFGDNQPIGQLDGWNKDAGGPMADITGGSTKYTNLADRGNGMFANGSMIPAHTVYNWTRTTQINPYWESQDGALRFDVSLIQSIDRMNGMTNTRAYDDNNSDVRRYRSVNYGVGSATARVVWKPIEGLKLTASAMNLYSQSGDSYIFGPEGRRGNSNFGYGYSDGTWDGSNGGRKIQSNRNNSAVNLAFQYRPCFFNRLNIWSQWTHGWNEAWVDNMDSDSIQYGASYDITDQVTFFAMGEYLRTKNKQSDVWNKASGWAVYTGLRYVLPYGVNIEAGWRHEKIDYKGRDNGTVDYSGKHTRFKADTIYAHLGFNF